MQYGVRMSIADHGQTERTVACMERNPARAAHPRHGTKVRQHFVRTEFDAQRLRTFIYASRQLRASSPLELRLQNQVAEQQCGPGCRHDGYGFADQTVVQEIAAQEHGGLLRLALHCGNQCQKSRQPYRINKLLSTQPDRGALSIPISTLRPHAIPAWENSHHLTFAMGGTSLARVAGLLKRVRPCRCATLLSRGAPKTRNHLSA